MSGKPNIQEFDIKVPGAVSDEAWQTDKLSPEDQERKAEIDRVLDPVVSMQDRKDTKDLTLEEIKARDEDNLKLILDRCYNKLFRTGPEAMQFIKDSILIALKKMGVKHGPDRKLQWFDFYNALTVIPGNLFKPGQPTSQFALDCIKNDVRLEIRTLEQYPNEKEKYKAGAYFYHGSEIAYFIGLPEMQKAAVSGGGHIIMPHSSPQRWWVRTNVPGL